MASCWSKELVCPTIGCLPRITMTYAHPVPRPYPLSVEIRGKVFSASCPVVGSPEDVTVGISACDGGGFSLQGVDLGHAANGTVDVSVSIDGGVGVSAAGTLKGVANSRDCDVVCFIHEGTVAN